MTVSWVDWESATCCARHTHSPQLSLRPSRAPSRWFFWSWYILLYFGRRMRHSCPILRAGVHERTARCRGGQVGQAAYRLHQLGQGQVGLHLHNLRRILKNTKMLVLVQCALSRRRQKGGGSKSKTKFFINKKRTWYYSTYQLRYKQFFIIVLCANGTHPKCWHNVTNDVQIALAGDAKSSKQKTFG